MARRALCCVISGIRQGSRVGMEAGVSLTHRRNGLGEGVNGCAFGEELHISSRQGRVVACTCIALTVCMRAVQCNSCACVSAGQLLQHRSHRCAKHSHCGGLGGQRS